jgi:nickel-dependent lactate racemase
VSTTTVGEGLEEGYLTRDTVQRIVTSGLEPLPIDGKRVLAIIPDGTRTMPMPLLFEIIERAIGRRTSALDFLIALGTHSPMGDADLSRLVGRPVADGRAGTHRLFNHRWDDPASFTQLGTIPASEIEQ